MFEIQIRFLPCSAIQGFQYAKEILEGPNYMFQHLH